MRNEYPRPDFKREEWRSLNGPWEFKLNDTDNSIIEVPFVCQSELSKINRTDIGDYVTYSRSFEVPHSWHDKKILLHFGGVDWRATVFINGHRVAIHEGGSTPFTVDVTDFLCGGMEHLRVEVYDPIADETIPRGKQFWREKPEFIWYTPSTGIWQSVWLEPVEKSHWEAIRFTPDIDRGTVEIEWHLSEGVELPCRCRFKVTMEDTIFFSGEVVSQKRDGRLTVDIFGNQILNGAFHRRGLCWRPEAPVLFDVNAELYTDGKLKDSVKTYFGMRKISIVDGKIYLNNFPYYQKLVLDQGYWRDGLLTAKDEQCYKDDIIHSKAMGFNGCRKHEKAEDPVFLYWADHLGYLVWSGMPSFISWSNDAAGRFAEEWRTIIRRDYNHPCIVAWEMLNESWGVPDIARDPRQQAFAKELYHLAKSMDSTRLVVDNDGWEQTCGDICAIHTYQHGAENDEAQKEYFRECLSTQEGILSGGIMEHRPYAEGYTYSGQPIVLSEFGGISVNTDKESWGYTQAGSTSDFINVYKRLIDAIYASRVMCGFCYTQFTDVQQEQNGLLDYDHKPKFNIEQIKEINDGFHY